MNQENNKLRNTVMYVIALCITAMLYALGAVAASVASEPYSDIYSITWIILLGLLVLLFIFSKVASRVYVSRFNKMSVAEKDQYVRQKQKVTGEDLDAEIGRMKRLYRFFMGYTVIFGFLLTLFAFLSGSLIVIADMQSAGFMLISLWCIEGFIRLIPKRITEKDFADYSDPADYPYVHSLARRAADTLGVKGEIRILLTDNYDAAIARVGRKVSVLLGTRLLDVLSENEVYNILLHEFGHLTEKVNKTPREGRLYNILSDYDENKLSLFKHFVSFPAVLFLTEYTFYSLIASIYIEKEADRAVLEHGDPRDAARALVKIHLTESFGRELQEFNIYESEKPREDLSRVITDMYKNALRERGELWLSFAKKEIQPRNASHPILKSRVEALGITEMEIVFPEDEGSEYRIEATKAFEATAANSFKYFSESYENERRVNYVNRIEEVKHWEENGCNVSPEESRPIIDALCYLCRFSDAEALCDRVISEADNKFATAFAHYIKGFLLARRYDVACLEHLYTAIELNRNYTDSALELIGEFCCITGNQEELDEYRRRAIELSQRSEDETSDGIDDGKLHPHTLSEEKLNTILEYIKSVDEKEDVVKVYCFDQVSSKNFRETAFVLKFKDSSTESAEAVYNKVFNLLDTDPDGIDYSLYVYSAQNAKKIDALKGAEVFNRS